MRLLLRGAAALATLATVASLTGGAAALPRPGTAPATQAARIPDGVTAGIAVFDRRTGTFTEQVAESARFRSASVVKLLLALDFLWERGPGHPIPEADRALLEPMLRSSDDKAANHYWSEYGGSAIIDRMTARLGLRDTAPPPAGYEGYWGYTALSARDTVAIYRYILDEAPAPVRDFVMDNLRRSTRCASDSFDQHFGIAGSFDRPWAVKQGWSGEYARGTCGASATAGEAEPAAADGSRTAARVDLTRPALHTTGTVGADDRTIVAVLTLHPVGTSYGKAYTDLGLLTRSLDVPGGVRPAGAWFGTWGEFVNVRKGPATGDARVTRLPAGVGVLVGCQTPGQVVSVPPYTNEWWAYLPQYGGYISNVYISSPDNRLPGVPECGSGGQRSYSAR
ncbi:MULTISPECIES: SH3 domain-containing protein [Streptomyces]|uniref:Lipoprotein n=1 Tax=Streptomyces chartreusis NRRL 3882 TaxID=1079985 RepID=A0A2N9B1U0_STRCX|nr:MULTISPECIES: SH3 domain-containing protein [Streptomyces]MYS93580.1 hypothetical protein [Streptomyces sp. SID5464]SOR77296.1 hypothetical protein SCNRRL3882_0768 [Streptomyces chartreusis NRRL 3882]